MALRIHLPWGALLTALGFGAIAAGAAWLHAVDDIGHLYRQLALHAVGGMILGTAAWAFSERVAYAANLNTKPMLRLTLAGIVASYAGAWVASPHTEFTAGAPSVVAPVLSVVLYVAAGILPLIAALALLSFFETLFAAQRGGGNVASALKPVLSHAVLGIALGAVTGFVAWSLREEIVSTVVAMTGEAKRTSGWIDRRRALFTDVLRGSGCELLVVPLEPAPMAAGKPERSLIALRDAQPADEAVRLLRARAALHLYRRPYALTQLRGLASGEARVMHELAQSNLTRAEALAAQIADPAARLTIELELAEARPRYGVSAGARARRDMVLEQYPGYAALLHPALSGEEWFQSVSHELVQQQLAALGVQIEDNPQQKLGRDFHVLLASAYMQALSGDTGRALLSLWPAHLAWPALSGEATVPTFFQILETCEKLHEWTGDDRYRVLLLDLARRQREVWPCPWVYSFEAKHTKDAAEREHALAMALFLDPQSEHLAGFTKTQREAAAGWFERMRPFTKKQ
jgi:hypothetical protein